MRKINDLLEEYDESNQNPTNKIIHWICVSLIFFSAVGLIASIPAGIVHKFLGVDNPYANWAVVLIVFVLVYYVTVSIPIGFGPVLWPQNRREQTFSLQRYSVFTDRSGLAYAYCLS